MQAPTDKRTHLQTHNHTHTLSLSHTHVLKCWHMQTMCTVGFALYLVTHSDISVHKYDKNQSQKAGNGYSYIHNEMLFLNV